MAGARGVGFDTLGTIPLNSSSGNVPVPYGNTNRGLFAGWFNAKNIAKEDYYRQMQQIDFQNAFNANQAELDRAFQSNEAQKQRDYDERMANTQYQRLMADLKASGLNPILAFQNGAAGASAHGASASGSSRASSGSSSYKGHVADSGGFMSFLASIANIFAGLYTTGAKNATALATNKNTNAARVKSAGIYADARTANYQETYTKFKGGTIKTRRY